MSRLEIIVAELGGVLFDGGRRALIPGPGHGPRDRSVALTEFADGRIFVYCFSPRDDWRAVRAALIAQRLLKDESDAIADVGEKRPSLALQPQVEEKRARAQRFWDEARPIASSIAERYLHSRAIARSIWDAAALRFHPRMTSLEDRARRPALLAALRDENGALQGVQATLLSAHGGAKAALATPRRVIGTLIGGAVRLDSASDALVIAEGVETALSASAFLSLPAWAALSAENLSRFIPPPMVKRLVIAPDNDAAGALASDKLRARLDGKLQIDVAAPPRGYGDWNDVARARCV